MVNKHFYLNSIICSAFITTRKKFLKFLPINLYDYYALHMNNWNLQCSRWRLWRFKMGTLGVQDGDSGGFGDTKSNVQKM